MRLVNLFVLDAGIDAGGLWRAMAQRVLSHGQVARGALHSGGEPVAEGVWCDVGVEPASLLTQPAHNLLHTP